MPQSATNQASFLKTRDPGFPSLPRLSFPAVQDFAGKSQEALLSVQQELQVNTFPGNTFVFLPLISPHQLQQRFNVGEDDSLLVVARKAYTALKDEVNSLNSKRFSGLYVRQSFILTIVVL